MNKELPDTPDVQETLEATPTADVDLIKEAVGAMGDEDAPEDELPEGGDEDAPEDGAEQEPESEQVAKSDEPEQAAEDKAEGKKEDTAEEDDVPERTWKAVKRQQKEAREAKARLREMEGRVAAIEKERDHYKDYAHSFKAQFVANPLAFANANGVTFEAIANQAMNNGIPAAQPNPEPKPDAPQQDDLSKRMEALEARNMANALSKFKADVRQSVERDSNLLSSLGDRGIALVIKKAEEYAVSDEHVPEMAELLSEVEADVRSDLRDLASHQAVLDELGLVAKEQDTVGQSGKPEEKGRRSAPRALTNSARGAGPAAKAPQRPIEDLSEQELVALAVSAI